MWVGVGVGVGGRVVCVCVLGLGVGVEGHRADIATNRVLVFGVFWVGGEYVCVGGVKR